MPSDLSAAERAYERLKGEILQGRLGPGALDIGHLGDRLRMSATPVREALARLCAEHLVVRSTFHGYEIAQPSARALQHLYELNGALLDISLQLMTKPGSSTQRLYRWPNAPDYATGLTDLMKEIAGAQPNIELTERINETGDRLFAARRCEPDVFSGAVENLVALGALWDQHDVSGLRHLMRLHHQTRIAKAHMTAQFLADNTFGETRRASRP